MRRATLGYNWVAYSQPEPYCLLTRHHTRDENMAEDWPKIKARHTTRVSPWMAIIERKVEFAPARRV